MSSLKKELVNLAMKKGATNARITTTERMAGGPPSADPTYVLPEARSVVVFVVGIDRSFIPDYFGKVSRMEFKHIMYNTYQLLGAIGQELVDYLHSLGFKAFCPAPNICYRKGVGEPHCLAPDFSHRYAALASGLATQGWSGNVLTLGYRASAFYCSVITDAELEADEPLDEELCDRCKLCTLVCPGQFFSPNESEAFTLGGREYVSARKRSDLRCAVVCEGLTGIANNRKWSTWSTVGIVLPEDDDALPSVAEQAAAEPATQHILPRVRASKGEDYGVRGVLNRTLEDTNPTCGNCFLVCSGSRERRKKLVELLHSSGVMAWKDGQEVATNADTQKSQALRQVLKQIGDFS